MIEHMKDIYQIDNNGITNGIHAQPTDNELRRKEKYYLLSSDNFYVTLFGQ